jgi:energy-coupling factor transport system permease protein
MQIGSYIPKDSLIHRIDIRVRFLIFFGFLPAASFLSNRFLLPFLVLILFIFIYLSKIRAKTFWNNIKFYIFMSFIIFLLFFLFNNEGGTIFNRIIYAIVIVSRFILFISFGLLNALTTNPNDIPQALMKMKIPHRFGLLLMIGFRLYPLILNKIKTISDAIRTRGVNPKISIFRYKESIQTIKLMMIPIIISTLEIGTQMGETMIARGYNPYAPITISPRLSLKSSDYFFLLLGLGLLLISIIF